MKGLLKMKDFSDEHMSRLYEKFILEYYRKHHPELHPRAAQIEWNINKDISCDDILPIMQTDVVLHFPSRTLIIDAKYYEQTLQQHHGKKTIHSANIYQIQSYILNADLNHDGNVDGMLLYAKTQEQLVPDGSVTLNDGNVIHFKTLDLNQKFDKIEEQLEMIIQIYNC